MVDLKPTVRQRWIGLRMRQLRQMHGWNLEEAARTLEMSISALSKIENGRMKVRIRELPAFFDTYQVTDTSLRDSLTKMVRASSQPNWWKGYEDVVDDRFGDYLMLEGNATGLNAFAALAIPGILQTESYARALVSASLGWKTSDDVDRFVDLRMQRQKALHRDPPLNVWVVLTEGALRQCVGGPHIMREQLAKLLDLSAAQQHINVQILPFSEGAHAGMDGPFLVLTFDWGADAVYIDAMRAALYLDEPEVVDLYRATFDRLRSSAASIETSRQIIANTLKDYAS
jgi:transcriptional regulator with XRE-family HTH domain